jgi:hypothetical protein
LRAALGLFHEICALAKTLSSRGRRGAYFASRVVCGATRDLLFRL